MLSLASSLAGSCVLFFPHFEDYSPSKTKNVPYSNRILPWLTDFGPLPWQAKQTVSAWCQLGVSFSLPHRQAKFC